MKKIRNIIILLFVFLFFVGLYQSNRDMPEGMDYAGKIHSIADEDIEFLYDLTSENLNGEIVIEQTIFDEVMTMIDQAQEYILIDAFLFNSHGNDGDFHRPLATELTDKLLDKKEANPDIKIDLITDPINTVYGGAPTLELVQLENAGVNVIVTNLKKLPDSNLIWSSIWRVFFQWFGNSEKFGLFTHPFEPDAGKVTARSYFRMFNFKANHRKLFMADSPVGMVTLITSANPHSASSKHSNIAIKITGRFYNDVYESEKAVARISNAELNDPPLGLDDRSASGTVKVQLLTENQIKVKLLDMINNLKNGDKIYVAMFYLSDRDVMTALESAASLGAEIRLILDPNKDAFGYEKNGIPNKPVAAELRGASNNLVEIRWYDTHGEQFHTKMVFVEKARDNSMALAGSANLTRRNLDNFNLETNVYIEAERGAPIMKEIKKYCLDLWDNESLYYSDGYEVHRDESMMKKIKYWFQEKTGLSSF